YLDFPLIKKCLREQVQRYLLAELRRIRRASAWQRILGHLRVLFTAPVASKQHNAVPMPLSVPVPGEESLVREGFSAEQISDFTRLRRWYQMCNREHLVMLRHWEFLKQLVNDGKLEL